MNPIGNNAIAQLGEIRNGSVLLIDTDVGHWAVVYSNILPPFSYFRRGELELWHRRPGRECFHRQLETAWADIKKAKGLRSLFDYVRGHDFDYLDGTPDSWRTRLVSLDNALLWKAPVDEYLEEMRTEIEFRFSTLDVLDERDRNYCRSLVVKMHDLRAWIEQTEVSEDIDIAFVEYVIGFENEQLEQLSELAANGELSETDLESFREISGIRLEDCGRRDSAGGPLGSTENKIPVVVR